jgi:hypothetical protein
MNNKSIYTIIIMFVVILLVSGCGAKDTSTVDTGTGENTATETTTGNENTDNTPVALQNTVKTKYEHLFDYSKTSNFQYRISTNIENMRNTIDTDYVITSDTSTGADSWLVVTSTSTETGIIKTNMWIDKNTHKCLKLESVIENGDQKTVQPSGCPITGLNSANYGAQDLTSMGKEEVNVPAGVFNADRYELEGITFWTDTKVGVPIKVIYNDGTVKMVLMKYS